MEEVKVKENVRLCEYGCGREAKHQFKNGKWCCEINQSKCPDIKEKMKQTCLKNHGVEYSLQSAEVREKVKQTCLKNHGVEYSAQSEEVRRKMKQTCLERYNVEFVSQSEVIKDKKKQTCLKNYGVEYPLQNKEIRERGKQTCIEKYGVEYSQQAEEIKDKVKRTCLKKYGVKYVFQSKIIKDKKKRTFLKRYGVDNYSKTDDFKQFARELLINRFEKFGHTPIYNPKGCNIIEILNNNGFNFQHAENGGEYRVIGYFLDGYDVEKNIALEIDEPRHWWGDHQEKDIRRQQKITEELGCRFVRVKVDKDNNILDVDDEEFKKILMKDVGF